MDVEDLVIGEYYLDGEGDIVSYAGLSEDRLSPYRYRFTLVHASHPIDYYGRGEPLGYTYELSSSYVRKLKKAINYKVKLEIDKAIEEE